MDSATGKDEEAGVTNPAAGEQPPPYQPQYGTNDNVPPSYEDRDPIDPPPSYDSIYGNLKAAKQESTGFLDFAKKFFVIILGTIACSICVGLVLAIPISMIVIGSLYKDDCRAEKFIPIYLIVAGVFGVIKNLSSMVQRIRNRNEEQDDENAKTNPFDGILSCFLFAWFIAGNVWIYRLYGDWQGGDPSSDDYCHPVCYWYAFWLTTATYIVMATTCVCCVCFGGILGLCSQPGST